MKPLKIYFRILQTGNGIYLKTRNEVNNLIVDTIDRNPSKSASAIREIAIEEFKNNPAFQKVLMKSERFFIDSITAVEIFVTFLPAEKKRQISFIPNGGSFKIQHHTGLSSTWTRTKLSYTAKRPKYFIPSNWTKT